MCLIAAVLVPAFMAVSCRTADIGPRPPIVQPGAPGQAGHVVTADTAADLSRVQATAADVKFMQGMIQHHAQALDMTDLLAARTQSEDMKKLALRISLSQADEIRMMRHWLEVRGQEAPNEHAHHMSDAPMMPGMLTPEEMNRLAGVKGRDFDRLFLEGMIRQFATPGAGQDSEIFAFASDVDADQRMEIDRMGAMLGDLRK